MKRFQKIFIFLLVVCVSSTINIADATDKATTLPNGITTTLGNKGVKQRPHRPGMPSRQIINCTYDCGELTIDFTVPEGMCEVVLTENTGMAFQYTVDSSELTATIFVGPIGESEIELTTESGNVFSGVLTSDEL